MPSFSTDGRSFFIVYITGPSHVRLGLEWAIEPVHSVSLDRLPPFHGCEHGELSETRIAEAVAQGVADANEQLGVSYSPARIVYVADDSPRYEVFRH